MATEPNLTAAVLQASLEAADRASVPDTAPLHRTTNMYSQLETMMAAVKKEALALDAMKQKIKDMDELRKKVPELKGQLATAEGKSVELQRALRDSEQLNHQMRNDMQRLNDLYNGERREHMESKQLNMQLESELNRVQQECTSLQRETTRIAELKKKNQGMMAQLAEKQTQLSELQEESQKSLRVLEKRLDESEKERLATGTHFWTISEEIGLLKEDLKLSEDNNHILRETIHDLRGKVILEKDRGMMLCEDLAARSAMIPGGVSKQQKEQYLSEIEALQADGDKLRSLLQTKEEAVASLTAKFKSIEDMRLAEKEDIKTKMTQFVETIAALKGQNHTLERQASDANHKLGLLGGDVSRLKAEVENAHKELTEAEAARRQREADFVREIKAVAIHKDEMAGQLQGATVQIEVLQTQVRDMQARHWSELQRTKHSESQIQDEIEALQQELQEKTVKLVAAEAERAKLDEFLRTEIGSASQMTNALRAELEKRLDELTATRKERDGLKEEHAGLAEKVAELEGTVKKNEAMFRSTLEADRSKIQQEVRSKMHRLKSLDIEKQELLKETQELLNQITEAQREVTALRQESLKHKNEATDLGGQLDIMKASLLSTEAQLKASTEREQELKERNIQLEVKFREDATRLEGIVRDSKKAAAQQVLEISTRVKGLVEDTELLKKQKVDLEISERRAQAEAEKLRLELENVNRSNTDMQQQMVKDLTMFKRDNQELRGKIKLMSEGKSKADMDMMANRLELTRAENEISRMTEWSKDQELKLQAADEQTKAAKAELEALNVEFRKSKMKVVDLEEALSKKSTTVDKQMRELGRLEREGLAEARRLRLQLAAAEREVVEHQAARDALEKELSDGKASFGRLQLSTNSTVNNLLAELKTTEDALSAERRKSHVEIESCHSKITELQVALEKAKDSFEDHATKTKADRNDKEMRVLQIEGDLERTRTLLASKETRIEELEKQHQADRLRIHELKEQLDASERSAIDLKANLELEQTQRRRLETRLRQAEADLAEAVAGGGGGGSLMGNSLNSLSPHSRLGGSQIGSIGGSFGGSIGGSMKRSPSKGGGDSPMGLKAVGIGRRDVSRISEGDQPYDDIIASPSRGNAYDDLMPEYGTLGSQSKYGVEAFNVGTGAGAGLGTGLDESESSYFGGGRGLRGNRTDEDSPLASGHLTDREELYGDGGDGAGAGGDGVRAGKSLRDGYPSSPGSGRGRAETVRVGAGSSSSRQEQSPADRVSAALAARAVAETSKSSLQRAQQARLQERQDRQQASSQAAGGQSSELKRVPSFGRPEEVRQAVQKATSALESYSGSGGSGGSMLDDGEDEEDDDGDEEDMGVAYYGQSSSSARNQAAAAEASGGTPGGDIQESIQKTQMFLQQRLASRTSGGGGGGGSSSSSSIGIGKKTSSTNSSLLGSASASALLTLQAERTQAAGGGNAETDDGYLAAALAASKLAADAFSRHSGGVNGGGDGDGPDGGYATVSTSRSDPLTSARSPYGGGAVGGGGGGGSSSTGRDGRDYATGLPPRGLSRGARRAADSDYDGDLGMHVSVPLLAPAAPSYPAQSSSYGGYGYTEDAAGAHHGDQGGGGYDDDDDDGAYDSETADFMGASRGIGSAGRVGSAGSRGVAGSGTKKKEKKGVKKKGDGQASKQNQSDRDSSTSAFLPKISAPSSSTGKTVAAAGSKSSTKR